MPSNKNDEVPNAAPVAAVCIVHGLFLFGCGYYGAAQHDFAPKVMHSLYMGAGGGASLALMGLLSMSGSRKAYMIGVHLALLLQLVFTAVFTWQAVKNYGVSEKADRFQLFVLMAVGSIAALGAMRALKPKPKEKK